MCRTVVLVMMISAWIAAEFPTPAWSSSDARQKMKASREAEFVKHWDDPDERMRELSRRTGLPVKLVQELSKADFAQIEHVKMAMIIEATLLRDQAGLLGDKQTKKWKLTDLLLEITKKLLPKGLGNVIDVTDVVLNEMESLRHDIILSIDQERVNSYLARRRAGAGEIEAFAASEPAVGLWDTRDAMKDSLVEKWKRANPDKLTADGKVPPLIENRVRNDIDRLWRQQMENLFQIEENKRETIDNMQRSARAELASMLIVHAVNDEDGSAVRDFSVTAVHQEWGHQAHGHSNAAGYCPLVSSQEERRDDYVLTGGQWRLQFEAKGFDPKGAPEVVAHHSTSSLQREPVVHTVRLLPNHLRVTVHDAVTGHGLDTARVELTLSRTKKESPGARYHGTERPLDGVARFEELPAGWYTLSITADGYEPQTHQGIECPRKGKRTARVKLKPLVPPPSIVEIGDLFLKIPQDLPPGRRMPSEAPGYRYTSSSADPAKHDSPVLGGTVLRQFTQYFPRQISGPIFVWVSIRPIEEPAEPFLMAATKRLPKELTQTLVRTGEVVSRIPASAPRRVAGHPNTISQVTGVENATVLAVRRGYAIQIRVRIPRPVLGQLRRFETDASPLKDAMHYLDVIEKRMRGGR